MAGAISVPVPMDLPPPKLYVVCHIGAARCHSVVGPLLSNDVAGGVTAGSVRTKEFSVPSKGCIIIVEPDDLIRELLERWLSEVGYQAVRFPENHPFPMIMPRLVITDISDPGRARNTIEALQSAYAAPILALSARFRHGLGGSSEPAQRLRVARVLPKPFTRQQLLRAVRQTLKSE
jgi:CheY-like chemotaxis protein